MPRFFLRWIPGLPAAVTFPGLDRIRATRGRKGHEENSGCLSVLLLVCGFVRSGPSNSPAIAAHRVIPLELQNPLDISKLTRDKYQRVVGAAREAMTLVQGDMNPEETKNFEHKWAVMADFPTPQTIKYLNILNPLPVEILKVRGLLYTVSEDFGAAWTERKRYQSCEKTFQEFTTSMHSERFRDVKVLNDLRNPKNGEESG